MCSGVCGGFPSSQCQQDPGVPWAADVNQAPAGGDLMVEGSAPVGPAQSLVWPWVGAAGDASEAPSPHLPPLPCTSTFPRPLSPGPAALGMHWDPSGSPVACVDSFWGGSSLAPPCRATNTSTPSSPVLPVQENLLPPLRAGATLSHTLGHPPREAVPTQGSCRQALGSPCGGTETSKRGVSSK